MIHTRDGYDFLINTGEFTRRVGSFVFFAKVVRAWRTGEPPEDIALSDLPFRPIEHWGVDLANAQSKAIKQIDDWFDSHPEIRSSPPGERRRSW